MRTCGVGPGRAKGKLKRAASDEAARNGTASTRQEAWLDFEPRNRADEKRMLALALSLALCLSLPPSRAAAQDMGPLQTLLQTQADEVASPDVVGAPRAQRSAFPSSSMRMHS